VDAPVFVRRGVPLAPLTTLELGGAAQWFAEVADREELEQALAFARERRLPVTILGGGSNVVVADAGVAGLVLRPLIPGLRIEGSEVVVGAGVPWDDVVAAAVARGLAGIECLSGIPGLAGAAPIQNIGAYGQEVGTRIEAVEAWSLESARVERLSRDDLGFGYRTSRLKREVGRWIVLGLRLRLSAEVEPPAYAELASRLSAAPTVRDIREAVLDLRRAKSMVIDPADPNRRSAGSFFLNPVIAEADLERLQRCGGGPVPSWPLAGGLAKVSAAWLIERAGFTRGRRHGAVGQSSKHALALVHHGSGSTQELLAYAHEVEAAVERHFGLRLEREPVLLGSGAPISF
jgi:UDP-N-acetylmuramate dehydrogenase